MYINEALAKQVKALAEQIKAKNQYPSGWIISLIEINDLPPRAKPHNAMAKIRKKSSLAYCINSRTF
jgi:hypothetical protein